jgi:hypothetical protein
MPVTPYGNSEPGDYPALFTGSFQARYPKGMRLIFGFAILNDDRRTLSEREDGEGLWAVAVCNPSGGNNPKSKPYKIRKAMLQPEEAADNQLVLNPPPDEQFAAPYGDRQRVLDIRVVCLQTGNRRVSKVTHICRPRDGVWQAIEGVYEGGQPGTRNGRPFWLQEDGIAIRYDEAAADRLVAAGTWQRGREPTEWMMWNLTTLEQLQQWRHDNGSLRVLNEEEIAALDGLDPARYRIAQLRASLGLLAPPAREEAAPPEAVADPIEAIEADVQPDSKCFDVEDRGFV